MKGEGDSDLQRRFAAWREQEGAQTPDYERVWRRAQHGAANAASAPVSRWRLAWALGAAAAVCAVFVLSHPSAPMLPTDEPLPTDFLLVASEDARAGQLAGEITALLQP